MTVSFCILLKAVSMFNVTSTLEYFEEQKYLNLN